MPDQVGVTVLYLLPEGEDRDFCLEIEKDPPYRACAKHYAEAKSALESDDVPTAEIDLNETL